MCWAGVPWGRHRPRLIHLALGNVDNGAVLAAANRLHLAFDDPATCVVVIE